MNEPGRDWRLAQLEAENTRLRDALKRVAWAAFQVGQQAGRSGATVWVPADRPSIPFRQFCDELAARAAEADHAG